MTYAPFLDRPVFRGIADDGFASEILTMHSRLLVFLSGPGTLLAVSVMLAAVAADTPVGAGTNGVPTHPTPASARSRSDTVLPHDSFTVQSAALGEPRPINVYTPPAYRAKGGAAATRFPVLYMPDGGLDEDFPHVIATVDSLIAHRAIRPVIVVGVPNTERRRDLTGPTRVAADSAIAPHVGGSAAFRRFLRAELLPEIERRYRTTGERGLMGESLAGLFVVETFLEEPALFTHYIAFDPSLWWNAGALADQAGGRIAAFDNRARTLFLASSKELGTSAGSAKIANLLRARQLKELRWTYEPHVELGHDNIFRTLKPAALVDAFRSSP